MQTMWKKLQGKTEQEQQCDEEPLFAYTDIRYSNAALSGMEPLYKRAEADNKKYIFMVTGKFSPTDSNG